MQASPTNTAAVTQILLVEDNAELNELLEMLLEQEGYQVTSVRDGEAAVRLLATGHYAVLLTDMQLPDMRGDALIRQLRAAGIRCRTVLMSAHIDVNARAAACGADDYFVKGDPFRQLLHAVRLPAGGEGDSQP
ncbi:MAG TPA: response regulator [Armatimonadota bacterium]|jgi:DNA-binding response OmpR family regulator